MKKFFSMLIAAIIIIFALVSGACAVYTPYTPPPLNKLH